MKKIIPLLAVSLAATAAYSEEDEAQATEEKPVAAATAVGKPAVFTALPFCSKAEMPAEVRKNGSDAWVAVEEGRFYPLGSAFRTKEGGRLVIGFGPESSASIAGVASFGTRAQGLGEQTRTIEGVEGVMTLDLARNLPEGAFAIALPGLTIKSPAGQAEITRKLLGDGDEVVVRCVTGSLGIEGRHFKVPAMHAADEVKIRSSHDNLETILYGTSGDYLVKLDQGVKTKSTVGDDGSVSKVAEASWLDWHLTPKTRVQINRAVPAIGERMSVAIMTFDAAGELKNNFAYAEGRADVNSGELVKDTGANAEALAKKAAEATETTAADVDSEDEKKSDEDDSENENKNKEDSDKE